MAPARHLLGLDPAAYFRATGKARAAVTIPAALATRRTTCAPPPIDIARQFVAANPGLRPDMMSVTCRAGRLEEVRICFTKDLRGFTACPRWRARTAAPGR